MVEENKHINQSLIKKTTKMKAVEKFLKKVGFSEDQLNKIFPSRCQDETTKL